MKHPIILFDSHCSLCCHSVAFILRFDSKKQFMFAPLQGKTADELLKGKWEFLKEENTLILIENQRRFWIRGRALFRILWLRGGIGKIVGWLCFIPIGIDPLYRLIARYRHWLKIERPADLKKHYPDRFLK